MNVRDSQILEVETLYADLAELQTENQSLADELADRDAEIKSLRAQLAQMMCDRSMVV